MERIETHIFNENTLEHLHRYAFVRSLVKGKIVLDIASGEGYGSYLIAKTAKKVYGVDIDPSVVRNATVKYKADNLTFLDSDIRNIPFEQSTFDIIICFETIEHVENQDLVMTELKRVLKTEGVLIISTPEKKRYSDDRNFKNIYHVKEFYEREFKSFVNNHFKNSVFFHQYISYGSFIHYEDDVLVNEILTGNYNKVEKITKSSPLYILAVCSDSYFPKLDSSIFNHQQLKDDLLMQLVSKSKEEEYILIKKSSMTYKLINFFNLIKAVFSGISNRS
jgi:2-polyprenyl-3-methyl-5-hydroxy-6-metoxy-1,4-benzoquinol methylase